MNKRVVCKWCGHSKSITKDIDKAYQQGREDTLKQFENIDIHNIALDYERPTMPMLMNFWNEFSKLTNEQLKKMNTERPGEIKNE